jgi:hypothetical protein
VVDYVAFGGATADMVSVRDCGSSLPLRRNGEDGPDVRLISRTRSICQAARFFLEAAGIVSESVLNAEELEKSEKDRTAQFESVKECERQLEPFPAPNVCKRASRPESVL